ncbi:MAG TPA: malto-oligosyltrehalose trehalohydrolase [Candidatus Didemnitutus sp.]|nr:malto-oligosyltrehalose trehalohydrolase [Candidatus Didemnitutus sp.]
MIISIWAPKAKTVDLCLGERRIAMKPVGEGGWEAPAPEPMPPGGWRYKVSLDGGPPLPDPLARWQPDGVQGDSWAGPLPVLERSDFAPCGLDEAVVYEMHVGTFTPEGTYAAARNRVGELRELGITHVELMPVATFPGRHGWGYDGTFWFAPHPAYGTPLELMELVADCHRHGLAVLLDVVYNHFGPDGNYLPQFAPCFNPSRHTLWGEALNYDEAGSDGMRRLVRENATLWLRDYGFDGLRLDAVHAIVDTRAINLLEELATHVRQLGKETGRRFVLIAESDLHDPRLVRPVSAGGYGLDAFWADDFHHALHRTLTTESDRYYADFNGLADIARSIREGYVYQGQFAPSRGCGHGRPPTGIIADQLVFCIQNHDQVGNRAGGERLSQLVEPALLKLAAALLLLSPQIPLLFQGEEWGAQTPFLYFTDHQDPALGRAVTEGRRREFPSTREVCDPQDEATFRASQLNWTEAQRGWHRELREGYRSLIALHRRLRGAPCRVDVSVDDNWLRLDRGYVTGFFNFATGKCNLPTDLVDRRVSWSSRPSENTSSEIPGKTVWILE